MNKDLLIRLERHVKQMAPHQKERKGGMLLVECAELLAHWKQERIALAKLASDKPEFYNPLVVYEVQKLRDKILAET